MRFVSANDGQMYPETSPSGDQGDLLDTGWDVMWPGPARVYLSEVDVADVLCGEGVLDRPRVTDALTGHGWTAPDELTRMVADFEQQLAQVERDRIAAREETDGLLLALRLVAPDALRELSASG